MNGAPRGGVFPHRFSWFLNLPWRALVLSRAQLLERLALETAHTVLEVGAGAGYYSVAMAPRVRYLALLDLQPEMLRTARRYLLARGASHAGYAAGHAARLPFGERSFDRIVLVTVLGEIGDQAGFLLEARRVLKPDGILSISEHLPDPDYLRRQELTALLSGHGFRLVATRGRPWSYTSNFACAPVHVP